MAAPTPDTRVADAINRVLEAERETAGSIVAAQDAAQGAIEAARDLRRTVLETARRRAARVHEIAQAQLARRLAELDAEADRHRADERGIAAVTDAAIARLAARLTSGPAQ